MSPHPPTAEDIYENEHTFQHASGLPQTTNAHLLSWVEQQRELLGASQVYWCDGSGLEKRNLTAEALRTGVLIELNQDKLPGCYLHRSNPNDVARTEQLTFICTPSKEEAGPTNNWMAPEDGYRRVNEILRGSMAGKTMYVVPYVMGPLRSKFSKIGVQVTDSIYVVLNMRIMTRMGKAATDMLGPTSNDFNRGTHSVADCNPDRRLICHFPQDNAIISVGSGYGGNALLGKKCLALRIGSYLGYQEGWLAEHMLILGVESPEGQLTYVTGAFPSQCGKTNFAMLEPPARFAKWKVWTVGDDIAWLRTGEDGRLYAVNPENGYFGVAPGTSETSNPHAMSMIQKDTIFTNVAMTPDGDVWWEGRTKEAPEELIDWQGRPWKRGVSTDKAAHPNSRFTTPMVNNAFLSARASDPAGVPISAMIFGGRRANTIPLVLQSFDWSHGAFLGATLGSETTAAATGAVGVLRRDPMAMLPFTGYNMGSYWRHWLAMRSLVPHPPKIFMVNWFRKSKEGAFLWPGFGENMRVLQWIVSRARGTVGGQETLLGWVPREGDLDLSGLNIPPEVVDDAAHVDLEEWRAELQSIEKYFATIGSTVPDTFHAIRHLLQAKIAECTSAAEAIHQPSN